MDPASQRLAGIAFGRFHVLPDRRELLADGQPINLGGRAFDVLMALIEARGAVISKDALMARVWPGRIIEENSLAAQIAALRAAFGSERALIRTISGRGYQFTGEVHILSASPEKVGRGDATTPHASVLPPTNAPEPVSELIGRDAELDEVARFANAHRLVTLSGAGGIGKTRLALALARNLRQHFADGVWLADFSTLADPELVPAAVAAAVGLGLGGGESSAQRVAQALADRRLLLVLDTCEHVIAAAAAMAEAILEAGPAVHIIATSREALRAEGEWVYPVQPLAVPPSKVAADDDPLQYSAIRLFIERARAAEPRFTPDQHSGVTTAICRRLDGIPLAIELAAARVAALGVDRIAVRLDDRFHLLTGGRRTALPRHQTLRATLDWSYELLSEAERVILRRISVFTGAFGLQAATAVVALPGLTPAEVVDGLFSLVAKSLVTAEVNGAVTRYRLLDMTRAYALEKLAGSGEREPLAHRHAEYYRDVFERAEAEWEMRPAAEWLADYGPRIDHLRCALDWAFSSEGDVSIGVALTAAAVPLWVHLSLMDECRGRVERALSALGTGVSRDARREMKLYAALGASLIYTVGVVPEISAAWTKALEIAESLDDDEYRLRSVWGLWCFHTAISRQHRIALTLAERFNRFTARRRERNDRLIAEQLIGVSQHYLGHQFSARVHLDRVIARYIPPVRRSHIIRFQVDQRVMARAFLARVMWLQGFPNQATQTAETSLDDARVSNHAISMAYALSHAACPIALWVGDLDAAERYVGILLDHSTRHELTLWHGVVHSYQGLLVIKRGDIPAGLRLMRAGLEELHEPRSALRFMIFLAEMAEALGRAGQTEDGLAAIEEVLEWTESTEERWLVADLLRIKGELLLLPDAEGAGHAEDQFRQALGWAGRQGALSLKLRAATSHARLLRDQGRSGEGMALLRPVYDCFTQGFNTTDLKAAKGLLDSLA